MNTNVSDKKGDGKTSVNPPPAPVEDDGGGVQKFHSSLWKMPSLSKIPIIEINEKEVELTDLEPAPIPPDKTSNDPSDLDEDDGDVESQMGDSSMRQRLIQRKSSVPVETDPQNLKLWRRKLIILMWLNLIMRYRNKFLTCVELVVPGICFLVLCRSLILNNSWMILFASVGDDAQLARNDPFSPYRPMPMHTLFKYTCSNDGVCADPVVGIGKQELLTRRHFIVYAPNNTFVNELMKDVKKALEVDTSEDKSKFFGVSSFTELESLLKQQWDLQDPDLRYPYGVLFSFGGISNSSLEKIKRNEDIPHTLRYTIRTVYPETSNTAENFPFVEHTSGDSGRHDVSPYITTGFAGLQLAVDLAFINRVHKQIEHTGQVVEEQERNYGTITHFVKQYKTQIHLQKYDYPMFLDEPMKLRVWMTIVLAIIISYACPNFTIAQYLAFDSREGKMDLLKLHGLTPALHWTADTINTIVISILPSLCFSLILYHAFAAQSILEFTPTPLVWLFFFMHAIAQFTSNLFYGLFFASPTTAGMFSVFQSFAEVLIPFVFLKNRYLHRYVNVIICFLSPQWCLANGIWSYLQNDLYETGVEWYDVAVLVDFDRYIMLALPVCCILFIYTSIFYLFLTIYFDRITYKPYAPAASWTYPCNSCLKKKPEHQRPTAPINYKEMKAMYERPITDLKCSIRIRNLSKLYKSPRPKQKYDISLDNINVDMFEGEITAIVGPGGSGKTCLLHLIGGLTVPTAGFVEYKYVKVHEYLDLVNEVTSLCPQKNMLFDTLSVEEHVRLCCMVHGNSYGKSKSQAKMLLRLFNLTGVHRHSYFGLSKSQIKNLAMAMALASSPSLLLLDDPWDGMDIENTKQLWKCLLAVKHRKTIIITSSSLENVELYSDRVMVMVHGKMIAYGTMNRIKRYYDVGSVINIQEGGEPISKSELEAMIKSEVAGATGLPSIGFQDGHRIHRILLPFNEPYAALIEKLEDKQSLRYRKLWISRADLGALLQRVSFQNKYDIKLSEHEKESLATYLEIEGEKEIGTLEILRPQRSSIRRFRALVWKKWLTMTQKHTLIVTEFNVPILFITIIALLATEFLYFKPESLSTVLSMERYEHSLTLIQSEAAARGNTEWVQAYRDVLGKRASARLEGGKDMLAALKSRDNRTLTNYRQQAIVAARRTGDDTIGFYSSNSYHSCPIVLNLISNAMLRFLSDYNKRRDTKHPYQIEISNHPIMPYEGFPSGSTESNATAIYGYIFSIILAMIAGSELRLALWEKRYRIKVMELMTGVSPFMYWVSNAVGDLIKNALVVTVLMGVICLTNMYTHQFDGMEVKLTFALIMGAYLCWASIPYSYFLTYVLQHTSNNGQTHYMFVHFGLGILPLSCMYQMMRVKITGAYLYLRYILQIFPPYTITSAFVHYFYAIFDRNYCIKANEEASCKRYGKLLKAGKSVDDLFSTFSSHPILASCCNAFCKKEGNCYEPSDFFANTPTPGLLVDVAALGAQGIFYWILLLLTERKTPQKFFKWIKTMVVGDKEIDGVMDDTAQREEPDDVLAEHHQVDYMVDIEEKNDQVFLLQNLVKFYHSEKCIDHAYFSVPAKHITAVLGVSKKSGLSTLLELVTGELKLSMGAIYMDNEHVIYSRNRKKCAMKMGYCPQHDAVYPNLTGYQLLRLFAQLRGVPGKHLKEQIQALIKVMDLQEDIHLKCKNYRPGTLRRLCCAMALIGATKAVILDDPTADMDLHENGIFWKAINEAKKKGQSVLICTANEKEVSHYADKVIVFGNGEVLSVGTPGEIFKEGSKGFILSIRLRMESFKKFSTYEVGAQVDQLRDHIIRHLSPCELLLENGPILVYHLKDVSAKLSYAYGILEGARETFSSLFDNFIITELSIEEGIGNVQKKIWKERASGDDENEEDVRRSK